MTDSVSATGRPRLARRAMVRHDDVRGVDMVLLPERVITLNRTAAAVVHLCDGRRSVGQIVVALKATFDGPDVEADVRHLLDQLRAQGVLA